MYMYNNISQHPSAKCAGTTSTGAYTCTCTCTCTCMYMYFQRHPVMIGGVGVEVEIDESKFGCRKEIGSGGRRDVGFSEGLKGSQGLHDGGRKKRCSNINSAIHSIASFYVYTDLSTEFTVGANACWHPQSCAWLPVHIYCTCVCVCMCFSKPSRLPVYTCIYDCMHPFTAYTCIHVHLHVHNSILLLSPFLRLSLLSLFPFLSLMLVCYTHIFHVQCTYSAFTTVCSRPISLGRGGSGFPSPETANCLK